MPNDSTPTESTVDGEEKTALETFSTVRNTRIDTQPTEQDRAWEARFEKLTSEFLAEN